jgi:hypothetical protein
MCNYQGYEFGARYPDSVCIDGRLFDADDCDSEGNLYDREDDVPCPMCHREEAIRWHAEQMSGRYADRMKAARHLVADIINNRKTGNFPLPELADPSDVIVSTPQSDRGEKP